MSNEDKRKEIADLYDLSLRDYVPGKGIFDEDAPRVRAVKRCIAENLNEAERFIIVMYAELGSVRKLAEVIGVHYSTLYREIRRIRTKIKQRIK